MLLPVDTKAASFSSMNLLRGLSVSLRAAIGVHAGSSPQMVASSRQLGVLAQHSTPLPAAAAAACAAPQHRRATSTTAAAAKRRQEAAASQEADQTAAEPPAGSGAAAGAADSATAEVGGDGSSSDAEGRDSRTVHEPVAAVGAVDSGRPPIISTSSSSSRPGLGLPPRRPGPRLPGAVRRAPAPAGAVALRHATDLPSSAAVSTSSSIGSGSAGWGRWARFVDTGSSTPTPSNSSSGSRGSGGERPSSLGGSSSDGDSSSIGSRGWWRDRHMYSQMSTKHIATLTKDGLTALPNWSAWGNRQLLQGWQDAQQALPAALQRLAAVSRDGDGPVVMVMFDFETTGPWKNSCEPLELGAVTSDGQAFQQLICPLGLVPAESTAVHGLEWAGQLQGAPPVPVVFLDWVQWLTQVCTSTERGSCRLVLAGHNISTFDLGVLQTWFGVLGLGKVQGMHWDSIDTLLLAQAYQKETPHLQNARLPTLGAHFGFDKSNEAHLQAHRALGDVKVNQLVFRRLAEWRLGLQQDAPLSLDQLADSILQLQQTKAAGPNGSKGKSQPSAATGKPKPAAAAAGQAKQQQQQPLQEQLPPGPRKQRPLSVVTLRPLSPLSRFPAAAGAQRAPPAAQPPPQSAAGTTVQQPGTQQQRQQRQPAESSQPQPAESSQPQPAESSQPQPADSSQPQADSRQQRAVPTSMYLVVALMRKAAAASSEETASLYEEAARKLAAEEGFTVLQAYMGGPHPPEVHQQLAELADAEDGLSSFDLGDLHWGACIQGGGSLLVGLQEPSPDGGTVDQAGSSSSSSLSAGGSSSGSSSGSSNSSSPPSSGSTGSSSGSRRSSGGSWSGSRPNASGSSSSSSGLCELDPEEVEAAVTEGLASLASQDLRWGQEQLAQAWPLLGRPLDKKDDLVSRRMYEKLIDAGFENYYKALQHTPTVVQYHSSIPLDSSSSSSSSESEELPDDSVDGAGEPGGVRHHVLLRARVLATSPPRAAGGGRGAVWSALLEAPTDPPSAGPVGLWVSFFMPGQWVLKHALAEHKKALDAIKNGTDVLLKARVKPLGQDKYGNDKRPPSWKPPTDLAATWETCGSPPVVSWDGSNAASSQALEAQYRRVKDLTTADWLGSGRSAGIITPLLDAVKQQQAEHDWLPEEVRSKHELGDLIDDLRELHSPTSQESYQRACKGHAMRELVLMQVAQFLERYRLTSAPDTAIQAMAEVLQGSPDADGTAAAKPARRAAARTPKAARTATAGTRTGSPAGTRSMSTSTTSSSSSSNGSQSDDDTPLSQRLQPATSQPMDAFDTRVPVQRLRSARLPDSPATRSAAAYSIQHPEAIAASRAALRRAMRWDLTAEQERVLGEVLQDMLGPRAMLRLLQGDVGCGKTVIALLACLAAAAQGYQALLFAPTELLAGQHYKTLERLAEELPMRLRPRVGMLVGSSGGAAKKQLKAEIASGEKNVIISTQAALWVNEWAKLALVVVDEQHKLGVKQRERLTHGLEAPPHMLLMTATPIPRTLAILQCGGLALSTIRELPPGRTPVETHVVQDEEEGRQLVYDVIRDEIRTGGRAYIVCPLVNESDAFEGARTVQDEFDRLSSSGIFGDSSTCGMLHGKMTAEEKAATLERFRSGETPVLIASTVVEVGVDVPEASVMLVEAAHRFGLAQLHQLRGRVGRGAKASRCFLMAPAEDPKATQRLQVLEESSNGLDIAQADLDIRGPGDLWSGTKQSGKKSQLSPITLRQLEADLRLVEHARYIAAKLLPGISSNDAVKAALLGSGVMVLQEGQTLPVARYGISGM